MVPWLPRVLGMATPSDTVLEDPTMLSGIEDLVNKPLLVAWDNDRWRGRIDLTW